MERYLRERLGSSIFDGVSATRSRTMAAIRSKGNKTTELVLRMALVRARVSGWKMHPRPIKGKPDFYFPTERLAVFVDGCFWHGCGRCGHTPQTRSEYWTAKFTRNQKRDRSVSAGLRRSGVKVLRVWEHQLTSPEGQLRTVERIRFALDAEKPKKRGATR